MLALVLCAGSSIYSLFVAVVTVSGFYAAHGNQMYDAFEYVDKN